MNKKGFINPFTLFAIILIIGIILLSHFLSEGNVILVIIGIFLGIVITFFTRSWLWFLINAGIIGGVFAYDYIAPYTFLPQISLNMNLFLYSFSLSAVISKIFYLIFVERRSPTG